MVRATHLLVLHELRRYVRLPMLAELEIVATVDGDKETFRATANEISAGGMSICTASWWQRSN